MSCPNVRFPGDNGVRMDLWASGTMDRINEWSAAMNVGLVHGLFVHMLPVKKGSEHEKEIAWQLIRKELNEKYSFRHSVGYLKSMFYLFVRRLYSSTKKSIRIGKSPYYYFDEVFFCTKI